MSKQRAVVGASSRSSATSTSATRTRPPSPHPAPASSLPRGIPLAQHRGGRRVLAGLAEVTQPDPTRAAQLELRSGVTTVVQSIIDRIFSSLPSTAAMALDVAARARPIALAIRTADFEPTSDHVVVTAQWTERRALPPHRRLVPHWVTRPRVRLRRLNLDALAPGDALRRTN